MTASAPAPVRLGVVGCGAFARFALEAAAASPLVDLVALADPSPDCRRAALHAWRAARPGGKKPRRSEDRPLEGQSHIRMYDVGTEVCGDPHVDLVWILAPPYLHYPLARAALERGKAVFLEKPGAMRTAEMEELGALAARAGVPASVNFVLRRTPVAQLIHRILRSGVVGAPERAVLENVAHDEQLPEGHWFWNAALSGGIFVEHGVHFFDLANWWLGPGEVKASLALRRTRWKDAPVDRVLCTSLHGPAAAPVLATYYHSFTTVERFERARWHLVLRRGFLDVEGWIPTAIRGEVLVTAGEAAWLEGHVGCVLEPLEQPRPDRDHAWAGEGEPPAGGECSDGGNERPHRGQGEPALRFRARLLWESPDRTGTYRQAIRAGVEDTAACLTRGGYPAVSLDDARRALEMACTATSLAVVS